MVVEPEEPLPTPRQLASEFVRNCVNEGCGYPMDPGADVDTLITLEGLVEVRLNAAYAQEPTRESDVLAMESGLKALFPEADSVLVTALGVPVRELVPNHLRTALAVDEDRRPAAPPRPRPMVQYPDRAPAPSNGLFGRHVAIWGSHGWYYEPALDRWEWQRARLFTTVEDVLPTSFVLPYLAPMLERAGAHVWMPRERDVQPHMVVVDNDDANSGYRETCNWSVGGSGFAMGSPPYETGHNPWQDGTARRIDVTDRPCTATWQSRLPEAGSYAVYVGYGRSAGPGMVTYTVSHAGGDTRVVVDQRMAPGTWVYLGHFEFDASAAVTLTTAGATGAAISADAVRFGGGMGLIERGGRPSGRARWLEGARYALQFDGMPAALVYNVTEQPANDYVDDYRNRGEWVNFLRGAPLGPNKDQLNPGLGVPVDVSIAFHTDAGITPDSTTIGTLLIYSSRGFGDDGSEVRTFGDGMSRFANRDFADLLQEQIVADLRDLYDADWTRRPIWDRDYSEAYRPNMPSALLELLSHQNFADMRFALDPQFRFHVSRAIYKAVLRFVALQYGEPEPVIQPLAPTHLSAVATAAGIELSWQPNTDPLEPSAMPESFRVYLRRGIRGFDDGRAVQGLSTVIPADSTITGMRVTALNGGGESRPSEVVTARAAGGGARVLVVSAFDRIGPPAAVDVGGWRGFPEYLDHGVPDGMALEYVGAQHQFDTRVVWRDDDEPGHGASHADWETSVEPGNTFDFAASAGADLLAAGAGSAFDVISDERLAEEPGLATGYDVIYVLLGEERAAVPGHPVREAFRPFSAGLRQALRGARERGRTVLVSGSYVTEELTRGTEEEQAFAREVLRAVHRSERASRSGTLRGVSGPFSDLSARFNTDRGGSVYAVEAPEAIMPGDRETVTVLRYGDSNMSAAVAATGVAVFGFPLESVTDRRERIALIQAALQATGHHD